MTDDNSNSENNIKLKTLPIIFLVNKSGSMAGAKISSLNQAMQELLSEMDEISNNFNGAPIKIGVLEFSSVVKWMYEQLEPAASFQWRNLITGGESRFGAALDELNNKLSRDHGFLNASSESFRAPVIILLTDSSSSDDYIHSLEALRANDWFKVSMRIAIAIGDDASKKELVDFTGNAETVLTVHNFDLLKKIIRPSSEENYDDSWCCYTSDYNGQRVINQSIL